MRSLAYASDATTRERPFRWKPWLRGFAVLLLIVVSLWFAFSPSLFIAYPWSVATNEEFMVHQMMRLPREEFDANEQEYTIETMGPVAVVKTDYWRRGRAYLVVPTWLVAISVLPFWLWLSAWTVTGKFLPPRRRGAAEEEK